MIDALRHRWDEWRDLVDADALKVAYSPQHGLVVGAVLVLFALAGAYAPYVSDVLVVDAPRFAVAVGPAWLLSMVLAFAFARGWLRGSLAVAVPVLGAGIVIYEAGSMVAFATGRAAPALASLVALTALAQAQQGLSTLRFPFVFAADALGLAAVSLHTPSADQQTALLVSGVGGMVAGLLVGDVTVRSIRSRRQSERMRTALESQISAEAVARTHELEGLVADAHARRHDVRNALMRALIELEVIDDEVRREKQVAAADVENAVAALRAAVLLTTRPPKASVRRELVAIPRVVEPLVRGLRARFPRVTFGVELDDGAPLVALVEEGETGLRRILENILVNSAEGDGRTRAHHVTLRVSRPIGSEMLMIQVVDDGPGFLATQLAEPIRGFKSTKEEGTGLGLFTVANLARASGGWVERSNGVDRGAIVTVSLPVEAGPRPTIEDSAGGASGE